ncbi:MAG: hypothetical protein VX768_10020 [Planctomycetota bacterium]|nr:hypothetical protein [Planctomycetota bacterium]
MVLKHPAKTAKFCAFCLLIFFHAPTAARGQEKGESHNQFQQELKKVFGGNQPPGLTAFKYLRNLVEGKADEAEFLLQIQLLGSDQYAERQNAEAFLFSVPVLPEKYRNFITDSPDMEIRFRLKSVFEHRKKRVESLLRAALRTIETQKQPEALPVLFRLLEQTEANSILRGATRAIQAVASEEHLEFLARELSNPVPRSRLLAARLTADLDPVKGISRLEKLLLDSDDLVRLAVSKILVDQNRKVAVRTLVDLLSSEKISVATRSEQILRAATGKNFGFVSHANRAKNQQLADAWKAWQREHLESFTLRLPLRDFLNAGSTLNGHTLIAKDGNLVIELDADRNQVFRLKVDGVLSAEKTIEGNYLLFSYSRQWLREYSPDKKLNWQILGTKFNNAMPLSNGNVLVTIGPSSLAREITPGSGTTVWEYKAPWWPNDAFRLENGNTLIAGKGGVIEVSPEKKIIWQYKNTDKTTIVVAKPTTNQSFLIGWTSGRVLEINRDQETVWEYTTKSLSDVYRDGNGNTLFAAGDQIFELDADENVVWKMEKQGKTATVRR